MSPRETVWVHVTVVAVTTLGALLDNGHRRAWIPKSQILDREEDLCVAMATKVELPLWLAEEAGLV